MGAREPDAYRRLGLEPGASDAEIKRAYRALAKRFHPDAPGGSVARFLEVQAAYERLLGTSPVAPSAAGRSARRPAQGGGPGGPGSSGRSGATGADWARRPGGGGARRRAAGAGTGGDARAGTRPDTGSAGASGGGSTRSRGRRRATLGSTSYDDAEAVFEPDWEGAAWYGPTSGTYWTLNPKEYADPRKHGPEYQARARRRTAGDDDPTDEAPAGDTGPSAAAAGDADRAGGTDRPGPAAPADRPADPAGSRASSGSSDDGLPAGWRAATWTAAAPPGARPPVFEHDPPDRAAGADGGSAGAPAAGPVPWPGPATTTAAPRSATPDTGAVGPGVAARVVLALMAWLVPGVALAAVAGLPGGLASTLPLQVAGVAGLAFLPRAAWAGIGGGLVVILGAIPIVALTSALGVPVTPGGPALAGAVALAAGAWLAGTGLVASGRLAPYPWARPRA